jgi:hypothetical protein
MIEFAGFINHARLMFGLPIAERAVEISVCIIPGLTRCGVASSETKPGSVRKAAASPRDSVQAVAMISCAGTPYFDAAALNAPWYPSQTCVTVTGSPFVRSSLPATTTPLGVTRQITELR